MGAKRPKSLVQSYISLPISFIIPPLHSIYLKSDLICCIQVILSACSLTFKNLLKQNPSQNPVILLWVSSLPCDSKVFFQCLGSISFWCVSGSWIRSDVMYLDPNLEDDFKELEPRLEFETRHKYGWFLLKLQSMFQD